ncbi:MAG: iron-containing alcohol dehydrogenase [Eubacteriales bacterium]|jgi:alcohol dehydrogenase YqhD (iron-dependent ADH family)|nr:iron-containing alcohol dehydrogenase [Eubacteriales bacterium]MDD4285685.1 iron-containing alcohol dehydrogenase [Eubacteriales bacterium]NLV70305.1 iron-containing alcohol dehydrogenase [Clostridiales bacterium]HPF18520.1 iron-containing alcohol dehydrogenase [Bacillota bacterium]HRV33260.1 iron-containing alcohol dehydrogenase [Anaerovoracaceae bacterium]
MLNFQYYTPTKVVFGKDTDLEIGALVKSEDCKKVLIHYGSASAEKSGLLDRVRGALSSEGIAYAELGGVVPNPRLSKVYEGIALCKKEGVDFILAVGGGSVIDSAKAIGYGAAEEGDVWELYDYKRQAKACLPVGVILTIAAAGSEMSNSSVITKEDGWIKRGYGSELCRPRFAVMNPELTYTLPHYQTMSGCTDILMHTMERYFNKSGSMEMTDRISEALLNVVMKSAKVLRTQPENYEARAEVMWAGSLSHNDLTGCGNDGGDWSSHRLEHELGGMFDVAHGAGLAAVWGSWARYVFEEGLDRFSAFAWNVMDVSRDFPPKEAALAGIEAMEDFFRSIDIPVSVSDLGVELTEEQIDELAEKCSIGDTITIGVIKKLKKSDMAEIYRMAK